MTKYRTDQINDLMDQVRRHHEQLDSGAADGFEPVRRDPARQSPYAPQGPHRPVDLDRAYNYNLGAAAYANVEAFGRRRKPPALIRSSSTGAGSKGRLPPQTQVGHAGLPPPADAATRALPRWARQEVAYEEAVRLIEERARRAALGRGDGYGAHAANRAVTGNAASRADTDARANAAGRSAPHPEDRFDAPPQAELTDANFRYRPGESYFESLAAGARVVAGEGAPFVDPEGTQTFFGRPS